MDQACAPLAICQLRFSKCDPNPLLRLIGSHFSQVLESSNVLASLLLNSNGTRRQHEHVDEMEPVGQFSHSALSLQRKYRRDA